MCGSFSPVSLEPLLESTIIPLPHQPAAGSCRVAASAWHAGTLPASATRIRCVLATIKSKLGSCTQEGIIIHSYTDQTVLNSLAYAVSWRPTKAFRTFLPQCLGILRSPQRRHGTLGLCSKVWYQLYGESVRAARSVQELKLSLRRPSRRPAYRLQDGSGSHLCCLEHQQPLERQKTVQPMERLRQLHVRMGIPSQSCSLACALSWPGRSWTKPGASSLLNRAAPSSDSSAGLHEPCSFRSKHHNNSYHSP